MNTKLSEIESIIDGILDGREGAPLTAIAHIKIIVNEIRRETLVCPRCGQINPRLHYTFGDGEISVFCCSRKGDFVAPVTLEGSELSEDRTEDLFDAERERARHEDGLA